MLGVKFLDPAHALDKPSCILTELLPEILGRNQPLLYHRIKQGRQQRSLLKPRLLHNHNARPDAPLQSGNPMSISPVGSFGNTLAEQTLKPAPILRLKQRPSQLNKLPVNPKFHTPANIVILSFQTYLSPYLQ